MLQVTSSEEGVGIGSSEGVEVRVPLLLAGERARVRIEHVGRARRAYGHALEILEPAAARVLAPCPQHETRDGKCSGCPLMIASPAAQREEKRRSLARAGIEVAEVVPPPEELGYRWSSKRVARHAAGRVRLGSFRRQSHQLADMSGCLVDHPDIAACARDVAEQATRLGIACYDERSGQGDLRYVWLKTDGKGAVLVTLISASEDTRAPELAQAIGAAGVAWSVQASGGNAIRGGEATILRGAPALAIELCGRRIEVGPLGFLQPNPRVAELCYADLCGGAKARLCFDLYAGAGITTQLLAAGCERVVACDAYPESAAKLGAAAETVESFLARAEEAPDLVVANPPRAGMGDEVCDRLVALSRRGLGEIRVMSCNAAALRRDVDRLAAGFSLAAVRAYDTLPHTPHLEVVAHLRRI